MFRRTGVLVAAFVLAAASPVSAQTLTPPPMPEFPTGALPSGGEAGAFDRLASRLAQAPGVPWEVDDDLVVPALPDYDHLFEQVPAEGAGASAAAVPSLASALLGAAAGEAGVPLDRYVRDNMAFAANITGLSTFALSSMDMSDAAAFDFALLGAGSGFPSGGLMSPEALLARLAGPGVDRSITRDAAAFAKSSWTLNMPGTPTAPTPDVDMAALGFGLLMNRSFAAMASEFPDLLGQNEGVGSDEARTAWQQSMRMAFEATEVDLARTLPSSCLAGMLSVAANGSSSAAEQFAGCDGDCQAAGLYLNQQMLGMWEPSAFSTQPNDDDTISQSELERLPGWVSGAIEGEMSALEEAPVSAADRLSSSVSGACATAGPSAGALSRSLPDLLSALSPG